MDPIESALAGLALSQAAADEELRAAAGRAVGEREPLAPALCPGCKVYDPETGQIGEILASESADYLIPAAGS